VVALWLEKRYSYGRVARLGVGMLKKTNIMESIMPKVTTTLSERFWAKVDKTPGFGPNGDCWKWTAGKSPSGYGIFQYGKGHQRAHRYSWTLHYNDPGDLWVLHKCDSPACVNPHHLFLGTHQDNMNDKVSKNRQIKGEEHGQNKLTENEVRKIRARARCGENQKLLADEFNISISQISHIKRGARWKHL